MIDYYRSTKFPGENAHVTDRYSERFLFRRCAHRNRVVRRTVSRARLLRRVHHRHDTVRIRIRLRYGVHQGDQTADKHREQRTAEGHVLRGLHQGFLQPEPHQGGRTGDVQRRRAQPETEDYFADGRRHRRDGSFARFVQIQRELVCFFF